MPYTFQERLRWCSGRMAALNAIALTVSGNRAGTPYSFCARASPVLLSVDEIAPGNPSLMRVEYQGFAIDICQLGPLYPPERGDIYQWGNQYYKVVSPTTDDSPYRHVTSTRDRVIVHTVRVKR